MWSIQIPGSTALLAIMMLWSSCLVLCGFHLGFDYNSVQEVPNALLTIMCVSALAMTAVTLACLSRPHTTESWQPNDFVLLSAVGAVSTSQWLIIEYLRVYSHAHKAGPISGTGIAMYLVSLAALAINLYAITRLSFKRDPAGYRLVTVIFTTTG